MKLAIVLCLYLTTICAGEKRSRNATAPTTPATSTVALNRTSTPKPSPTRVSKLPNANTTSTKTLPPIFSIRQYYDYILETAKKAMLTFTVDLQRRAYAADNNILFSPANIVASLATLLLGSDGDTKSEILKVFGFSTGKNLSDKENQIHLALGSIFENFTNETNNNPATKVEVAQCIFLQNSTQIKDGFRNISQTIYKNEIHEIDFANPQVQAADVINSWIDDKTHHRIKHLIDSPIEKSTLMIITNTLFFNGEWASPFNNETTWHPFYTDKGNFSVKMMSNVGPAYRLSDHKRNYSVLGLPYKKGDIIMYIMLPNKKESLHNVLGNLTTQDLVDITTKSVKVEEEHYEIPFMNIEDDIELKDILESIGIKSIFNPSHANLSNIADDIFVSRIIHKANLEVTEAGSTGSASTAAVIDTRFPIIPFTANRPFACFVYHRPSTLISFWATINLPVPNKPLK